MTDKEKKRKEFLDTYTDNANLVLRIVKEERAKKVNKKIGSEKEWKKEKDGGFWQTKRSFTAGCFCATG